MRITIERLRTSIVIVAAVLLGAILLFFAYARYRVRHFTRDLPEKLGIDIQRSTNGFTFSKSEKGHTLFTLHASNAVQYKGSGRAMLHDVEITLYGNDGSRADRITGREFEYDPQSGVAHAPGEVEIDVMAPAGPGGLLKSTGGGATGQPVHVRTSRLVFNQKTGMASTDADVTFAFLSAQGSARGASYDSGRGLLVLDSAVNFRSRLRGVPVDVRAEHAQFLRESRRLSLLDDAVEYGGERSTSEQALVLFRVDGSAERINAKGHVHVTGEGGRDLRSEAAEMSLDEKSEPQLVALDGGLLFTSADAQRVIHGDANRGLLQLGPGGMLRHLRLSNAVSVVEDENGLPRDPQGKTVREVLASQLDMDFAPGADGNAEAQSVLASAGATVNQRTISPNSATRQISIAGDQLFATLTGGHALRSLRGNGRTVLTETNGRGLQQTSRGDTLEVAFAPGGSGLRGTRDGARRPATGQTSPGGARRGKAEEGRSPAGLVAHAEQHGNVEMVQTAPGVAAGKEPSRSTVTADQAIYDGSTGTVHLSGGTPRLTAQDAELTATLVDLDRLSGDLTANGSVKATFRQAERPAGAGRAGGVPSSGAEPMHITAERAHFDHDKDEMMFSAAEQGLARLWQGASSVSAPVITVSRKMQILTAQGASDHARVQAVFSGQGGQQGGQGSRGGGAGLPRSERVGAGTRQSDLVRIASASLLYSGAERKAAFRGNVIAEQGNANIRADEVDVFLRTEAGSGAARTPHPGAPQGVPNPQGSVERLVARGHVRVAQPGRRGSGETLLYTAEDGRSVLTGTSAQPPRLTDEAHGTVTGATLISNNRDGSVEVSGGSSPAVTETRTPR